MDDQRLPHRQPAQQEKVDELAIAGGMRGKAVEVVKSETNDHMIPAHAEMVIEGEVPLDTTMPEGPFGEMYQYLGAQRKENFIVNVTAVTHRKNPWIAEPVHGRDPRLRHGSDRRFV